MSFSDFYFSHRIHKDDFLNQIDQLIDWQPSAQEISRHYAPVSEVVEPLLTLAIVVQDVIGGLRYGGLNNRAVENMANVNQHLL